LRGEPLEEGKAERDEKRGLGKSPLFAFRQISGLKSDKVYFRQSWQVWKNSKGTPLFLDIHSN